MLLQITCTRILVVTFDKRFVGTIGLRDILAYQMERLMDEQMATTDIVNMTKTDVAVVAPDHITARGPINWWMNPCQW